MGIEMDWQILDEDETWLHESSLVEPQRRVPRRLWLALALIPILAIAVAVAYVAWTYQTRLDQVTAPVQEAARTELRAVAAHDRVSFMALQDPDDPAWRARQERNFRQLERVGLPELGWAATGAAPQIGRVSLQPGGALLEVSRQYSVTQPMPGGPTTVTLQTPEFYRPTPSGWVHAAPGADLLGPERTQSGKRVLALYHQLDAGIVEPLIPRMDDLVARLCDPLPCPSQISVVFENSSSGRGFFNRTALENSARSGRDSFGSGPATLRLPSPYSLALPSDANSRDELYRAFEIRLAQMLVSQSLGRNSYMNRPASQEIVQWELARVGLVGPSFTEAARDALAAQLEAGTAQPLSTILLRSNSGRVDTTGAATLSLAFAFLDQALGTGAVERLIPAMRDNATLGDAIHTAFHVEPGTLEEAWQSYLQGVVGRQEHSVQGV
jgi:hypothetical protein